MSHLNRVVVAGDGDIPAFSAVEATPQKPRNVSDSSGDSPADSSSSGESLLDHEMPGAANQNLGLDNRVSESGFFTTRYDYEECLLFNEFELNGQLRPGEVAIAPDTDGSVLHLLQFLVKAGVLFFDGNDWEQILRIANLNDFKSGEDLKRMEAFASRVRNYHRLISTALPWDEKSFREDQRCLNINRDSFIALLEKGFDSAIQNQARSGASLREVILIGDTTDDREATLGDIYRFWIARVAREKNIIITEMASNHSYFTLEKLRFLQARYGASRDQEESLSPLARFVRRLFSQNALVLPKEISEQLQTVLTAALTPSKVIDRNRLENAMKSQSRVFNGDNLLCFFNYLQAIPPTLFEEITEAQRRLRSLDRETPATETDKKRVRDAKKEAQHKLNELSAQFSVLLSYFPIKGPTLLKIMCLNKHVLTRCPELSQLIHTELGIESNKPVSEDALRRASSHISTRSSIDVPLFDGMTPPAKAAVLNELLNLGNKGELFQDITGMLSDLICVTEALLQQRTTFPDSPDLYRGSSYSFWQYWLPRFNSSDSSLDFEQKPEIDKNGQPMKENGKTKMKIFSATIRVGDEQKKYSNSTLGTPDPEKPHEKIRVALESPTHTSETFRKRMEDIYREELQGLDCSILDKTGNPTEHMQRRAGEIERLTEAWFDSRCLIRRGGLKGDYIAHAPGVILDGETADEGVVAHSLRPIATILLKPLAIHRKNGDTDAIKAEAKRLHKVLSKAMRSLPRPVTDTPTVHKGILLLIDAINDAYRFFERHHWVVANNTTIIPETQIGFLSRSPDADHWEAIGRRANRSLDGMAPQEYGSTTARNPIVNWIYPIAALIASRSNEARPEEMIYRDAQSQEVLCELQHNNQLIHGHTGVPGPTGKGIDSPWQPQVTEFEKQVARVEQNPDLRSLEAALSDVEDMPEVFIPWFLKQLIEAAYNEDEDNRQLTRATELAEVRVTHSNSCHEIDRESFRELLKVCSDRISSRIAHNKDLSVVQELRELLNAVAGHPNANEALRQQALLAKQYLPSEDEAFERANMAYSVRDVLAHDTKNGGKLKNAQLAEFWIVLFAFDAKTTSLLRPEMAEYFAAPSAYRKDIALKANADWFQDTIIRQLCETQLQYAGTTQLSEVATTPLQNVFAALAVPANVWVSFGMIICAWADFLSVLSDYNLDIFLGNWKTLLIATLFLLFNYILLKFNAPLMQLRDELKQKNRENSRWLAGFLTCMVAYLQGLKTIFPQFAGLSHQIIFCFFLRLFVYIELTSIAEKMFDLISVGLECENGNVTTTSAETTTTTSQFSTTTTTIGFRTYFGNDANKEYYPYCAPAVILGLIVSMFGLVLSIKDRTTKIFPGHEAPSQIIDRFERGLSKILLKSHSIWEVYNIWVDGFLFNGVGLYMFLVEFLLTCSRIEAALVASCLMIGLFTLRMIAYPPKCLAQACPIFQPQLKLSLIKSNSQQQPNASFEEALSAENKKLAYLCLKKVIPIISMTLNTAFILPLYFYFVYILYPAFAYVNFGVVSFIPVDLTNPASQGYWATVAFVLGALSLDVGLSIGRDFTATSDHDRAANVRLSASTNAQARIERKKTSLLKIPKASTLVTEKQISVDQQIDLNILVNSKRDLSTDALKETRSKIDSIDWEYIAQL
jgi:hypothetical protein